MNNISIVKGGGTSFGTSEQCHNFADRVQNRLDDGESVAVVCSAPNPPGRPRTTDLLQEMTELRKRGACLEITDESGIRLLQLVREVASSFEYLLRHISQRPESFRSHKERLLGLLSGGDKRIGEIRTARVPSEEETFNSQNHGRRILPWGEETWHTYLAEFLRNRGIAATAVDPRRLISMECDCDDDVVGRIRFEETYERIADRIGMLFRSDRVPVIGGYYGENHIDGSTLVPTRGGSDYWATIIARGIQASRVDICTDVPGVFQFSPKVVPEVQENNLCASQLSYLEILALARNGGRVVHQQAVDPIWPHGTEADQIEIPIRIVETRTGVSRTIINGDEIPGLKAIGHRNKQDVISITDAGMDGAWGLVHQIGQVFARHKIPIDVVTSEGSTLLMTFPHQDDAGPLIEDLQREIPRAHVRYQDGCGTVVLVGHQIRDEARSILDGECAQRIGKSEGECSTTVIVPDENAEGIVRRLYEERFSLF